ncbi:MAG: hypothetical protein RI911_389, partial [Candidatus Parcubacteria bacterium]
LDRTHYTDLLTHIALPGNVYILEYPGYGRRQGSPSKHSFFAAADEAIAAIKSENDLQFVMVGESVGSGVAAYAARAARERLRAMLFITPFHSFSAVVWNRLPIFPTSLLLTENYENGSTLHGMHAPAFFVLAEHDEVIGLEEGQALFQSYTGQKQKFVVPAIGHNEIPFEKTADWVREFRWFLKRTE